MTNAATAIANKPAWVDLGTKDAAAAREFYATLFGWDIHVSPDPQYGGYGRALLDGKDVAGHRPDDVTRSAVGLVGLHRDRRRRCPVDSEVLAAGGQVVMPAFDVGDQGRMAVFADPGGAVISTWQPTTMGGFQTAGRERVLVGRAQCARRRQGPAVLSRRVRVGAQDERQPGLRLHRVPGRRREHRRRDRDERDGAGRDAELLAGLLRCRRRRCRDRARRSRPAARRCSSRWTSRVVGCR